MKYYQRYLNAYNTYSYYKIDNELKIYYYSNSSGWLETGILYEKFIKSANSIEISEEEMFLEII